MVRWPPRLKTQTYGRYNNRVQCVHIDGIRFPARFGDEYLSLAEHEDLLEAARKEARKDAFEDAAMIVYKRFHGMGSDAFRDNIMAEIRDRAARDGK